MKNKLIAAMLFLTVQINGMDKTQVLEAPDHFLQFSMEMEECCSYESCSIEGDVLPQDRINELEEYYQSESKLEGNKALQDLNEVFNEEDRKSFFEELISKINDITNDAAMLDYISSAATTIIHSDEYDIEPSNYSDESLTDSADFIYERPFLSALIENLDPITRVYIRRVQGAAK